MPRLDRPVSTSIRRQLLLIPRIKQRVRSRSCRLRLESSDLRATIPGSACLPGHLNKLSIPFSPVVQRYEQEGASGAGGVPEPSPSLPCLLGSVPCVMGVGMGTGILG